MSVLLLTMGPQLGITADLLVVAVGGAGVIRFRAIGASGPVKWTLVDSTLPAEWDSALNPDGNAVTLTTSDAETAGTFSVTVRAVDNARIPVVRSFDVRVMALPLTISGAFPPWEVGVPATGALTITGGVPPYSGLSITSGALPAGVSLSIVGNQIVPSGAPTVAGPWSATLQVSDSLSTPAIDVVSGNVAVPTDPYWEQVVALLHFDGPDGSTTFTDQTGKTWTGYGNAQIDTAQSKFGGASLLLDGSGDYLSAADSDDFNFAAGDFTVEGWFREAVPGAIRQIIGQHTTESKYNSSFLVMSDNSVITLNVFVGSTNHIISAAGTHALNTWHHFAAVRDGGTLRLFLNGTSVGTTSISGAVNNSTRPVYVGVVGNNFGPDAGNYYFNGHIDELRITKGVARYTANFTPPTKPFPNP